MKKFIIFFITLIYITSCQKLVMNSIADILSSDNENGNAFTRDDDPQLIADALPFALKIYDTILEQNPDHTGLLLTTGSMYISYANAFIQTPAEMLPNIEHEKKQLERLRAKKFYQRGLNMIIKAIDIKYKGFKEAWNSNNVSNFIKKFTKKDVPYLYWCGMGAFAIYSLNPAMDIEAGAKRIPAITLINRAYELNNEYNKGAIDEFYILYYASMPASMGGDDNKALEHYEKAILKSKGNSTGPYLSRALALSIKKGDSNEFRELLNKVLSIDINKEPSLRLINSINQKKARWYLDNIEDYFLE